MKFSDESIWEVMAEEIECRSTGAMNVRQHLEMEFGSSLATEGPYVQTGDSAHREVSRQARRGYERLTHRKRSKTDLEYRAAKALQVKKWRATNRERSNALRRAYYIRHKAEEMASRKKAKRLEREKWKRLGLCGGCGRERNIAGKRRCSICKARRKRNYLLSKAK